MNLNGKRNELLRALSEKEFSLDFHIFVTEAVQDTQYISEEDAENVAKLIVDCVNAGYGEDEIIEKLGLRLITQSTFSALKRRFTGSASKTGALKI